MVLVAPSLLSANPANLGKDIRDLENAQADLLHFDVMDGHFVPNMTYGPNVLRALKKEVKLPFDVHLMVNQPEKFIPWYADAGADIITFHIEATDDADSLIKLIKSYKIKAGITLKPKTDMTCLAKLKELPDLFLVMGVEPGFGGQSFLEDTPGRITFVKKLFPHSVMIEVDGGINVQTAKLAREAGADILVAGTAVFLNGAFIQNIRMIKGETL